MPDFLSTQPEIVLGALVEAIANVVAVKAITKVDHKAILCRMALVFSKNLFLDSNQ
jgi:hypothetical protein